jgi:hypothetical protein
MLVVHLIDVHCLKSTVYNSVLFSFCCNDLLDYLHFRVQYPRNIELCVTCFFMNRHTPLEVYREFCFSEKLAPSAL